MHDDPVYTYAFLDGGSNSTFCTESLLHKLGIQGKKIKFSLTTLEKENSISDCHIATLQLLDLTESHFIDLPTVLSRDILPIGIDNIPQQQDVDRWPHLNGIQLQTIDDGDIGILIGNDNITALEPHEIRPSDNGGPYAVRTLLGGWVINGPLGRSSNVVSKSMTNCIQGEAALDKQFKEYCNQEFSDSIVDSERALSKNDEKAVQIMHDTITFRDEHYYMSLPFKDDPILPDNLPMAEHCSTLLKKRLLKDTPLYVKYANFMNDLLSNGFAEMIPEDQLDRSDGYVWYLPHHAVINPMKPEKIRVVFDCAAKYRDTSLNDQLLSGPDQTNTLIGVLLRFRQEPIALISDIKSMFHQVCVPEAHRDVLRFLWWPDGLDNDYKVFRMKVHIFGATSSPSCCNYALRTTAQDHISEYDIKTIDTVNKNFYVDDCLKSVQTEHEAVQLVKQLSELLKKGGFHLTKWASNSQNVMQTIPVIERATAFKDLDFSKLPIERVLGIHWDISSDEFRFKVTIKDRPFTRRGMLSIMSSVYDPLGFISPVILPVKLMLQEFCRMKLGWDDPITNHYLTAWKQWLDELRLLEKFAIQRCMKSTQPNQPVSYEIHHFYDASEVAYGVVSYMCSTDSSNQSSCSFVMGKSRVASMKKITIPRLELSAAALAVRQDKVIRQELDIPIIKSVFWTDSTSVLKFIRNRDKRFHTFVANRIALILDGSEESSWNYVPSKDNPADEASRGLTARDLAEGCRWSQGPWFMCTSREFWPEQVEIAGNVSDDHPEVKTVKICNATRIEPPDQSCIDELLTKFSSWHKLKKIMAWICRYKSNLMAAVTERKKGHPRNNYNASPVTPITVTEMRAAEREIIICVQKQCYPEELHILSESMDSKKTISKSGSLYKLNPIIIDGTLRVGGRLEHSNMNIDAKHQYILPKDHPVSQLIIRHFHDVAGHSGREYVLGLVRRRFWIIHANSSVRKTLAKCVKCRKIQGNVGQQKMADLPEDRLTPDKPPFTFVGIDKSHSHRGDAQSRYRIIFEWCFPFHCKTWKT